MLVVAAIFGWNVRGNDAARAAERHIVTGRPEAIGGRLTFAPSARPQLALPGGAVRPIASVLDVRRRMAFGEFVWNEQGVRPGRVWVRVDLDKQILSVFRGADEIGTTVVLYGATSKPTPVGRFPVLAKARDHRSATYGDAPMPFTLWLTSDGVAIHGSPVRNGAATHGCIGVPEPFAARLFEAMKVGDEVVIESSKT